MVVSLLFRSMLPMHEECFSVGSGTVKQSNTFVDHMRSSGVQRFCACLAMSSINPVTKTSIIISKGTFLEENLRLDS